MPALRFTLSPPGRTARSSGGQAWTRLNSKSRSLNTAYARPQAPASHIGTPEPTLAQRPLHSRDFTHTLLACIYTRACLVKSTPCPDQTASRFPHSPIRLPLTRISKADYVYGQQRSLRLPQSSLIIPLGEILLVRVADRATPSGRKLLAGRTRGHSAFPVAAFGVVGVATLQAYVTIEFHGFPPGGHLL